MSEIKLVVSLVKRLRGGVFGLNRIALCEEAANHIEELVRKNKKLEEKLQIRDNQIASKKAVTEELEIEVTQLKSVIGAMDDIITTPDNQIKVMLYDTLLERDELKKQNNCLARDKDHLQFLLDSVMLEHSSTSGTHCPDEITEEQMENWKKAQKKSNLETGL